MYSDVCAEFSIIVTGSSSWSSAGQKRLPSKYCVCRVTEIHQGIRGPTVPKIILPLADRGHEVEA